MPRGQFVAPLYKSLFDADPLLLLELSQQKYGKALLQHLLVYRPLTTSRAHPIDPNKGPPPPRTRGAPQVSQALKDTYFQARYGRADVATLVTINELEDLMKLSLLSDGSTFERADNSFKNHVVAEDSLAKWEKQEFDRRLRIAAIGYRVAVSKLGANSLDEDLCSLKTSDDPPLLSPDEKALPSQLGRTHLSPSTGITVWHDAISALSRKALNRHARIIVLPEFCLPPQTQNRSIEQDLRRACSNAALDYFFFAGTRHEGRYNRGLILSKRHGHTSLYDHWHYKSASARGLGENVLGPTGTGAVSYETSVMFNSDEMRVAIAICYDAYDPTTFLNVFLDAVRNTEARRPRVILVPSFNTHPDFVALLRDLSFLARCAVIYVNGLHGDAEMFMCGFDLSDFERRPNEIVSSLRDRQTELRNEIQTSTPLAGSVIDPRKERQRGRKQKQLSEVEILEKRINTLIARGALDHIVTFEDCHTCGVGNSQSHKTDRTCFRDIQYFNIDLALLSALFDFRRFYFLEESFLPDPLRSQNLQDSARQLDSL